MGDVLLVVCGGGAFRALDNVADVIDMPVEYITKARVTVPLDQGDDAVKAMFSEYRAVIFFIITGGEFATETLTRVIGCAREAGCRTITLAGIPFEIENVRRRRALDSMGTIGTLSDVTFKFDMQLALSNFNDRKADYFMKMVDRIIVFSLNSFAGYLEGPFFSTFWQDTYTFAYGCEIFTRDAVLKALDSVMYANPSYNDRIVIMVGHDTSSAEVDDIKDDTIARTGLMPEVIRRRDPDDSRVLVFLSVE